MNTYEVILKDGTINVQASSYYFSEDKRYIQFVNGGDLVLLVKEKHVVGIRRVTK